MRRKVRNVVRNRPRISYSDLMNMKPSDMCDKYKIDTRKLEECVRFDYCDGASRSDLESVYTNEIYSDKKRN